VAEAGLDPARVGEAGSLTTVLSVAPPPARPAGEIIEDEDTAQTVERIVAWLDERRLLA
jgi:electron transfer flavoprotein beta subunit